MRYRFRTPALLATLLMSGAAWAENSSKPLIMKTPNEYYIVAASENGKWACGVFADYSDERYGFLWNLESGDIEMLGATYPSVAYSVSDDGIVVGQYTDNTYKTNGASVTLAGYWADGRWNRLEMPFDDVDFANAYNISPDGHYVTGVVEKDGKYTGYVWKDGKIDRQLMGKNGIAMPYAITPDGKYVAGWVQGSNRQATLWEADGTLTQLSTYESPWSSGRKFSPDGKKLLFYDGWQQFDGKYGVNAIYDMETRERTPVFPNDENSDFDFFDISNSGTVMASNDERAYIYQNGKGEFADNYLEDRGVDVASLNILKMDNTDYYQIFRASTISADDNIMGFQYYNDDKASDGSYSVSVQSMIVKFNQQTTGLAPVAVKAKQISGVKSVAVSWKPNVAAEGISGYNVYRDNEKLNSTLLSATTFTDKDVAAGQHTYTVTAVYGDAESDKSQAAQVNILAERPLSMPQALFTQQHGYNSVYMEWAAPESNLGSLGYFNVENADQETFGLNLQDESFETAVLFDKTKTEAYQGMQLSAVGFYPLSEQGGWKINIYTHAADGSLSKIYSQNVTQAVTCGERNVVKLDAPVSIPDGDLIVAAEVKVTDTSLPTNTMDASTATKGYTDLVRLVTEADFYSIGELMESAGYQYPVTWALDATVVPEGADLSSDDVSEYKIYADGVLTGSSDKTSFLVPHLDEGSHTLGVSSVYANGKESEAKTTAVSIKPDDSQLQAVDEVKIEQPDSKSAIVASWQAPDNRDRVKLQYCGETASTQKVTGPSDNNYGLMASAIYPAKTFRGRTGYTCSSVRFYPLADAAFTVLIYKDGEQISETEVDDYVKGKWNTVKLSEPFSVEPNSQYQLVIDCYDVTPEAAPIAVDNGTPVGGYSDLYSLDGSSWNPISSTGVFANWMIGLNLDDTEAMDAPVSGYDVTIDGVKRNAALLTSNSFSYDFGKEDSQLHQIKVDVYYAIRPSAVQGSITRFYIGEANSIAENAIGRIEMQKGDNEIVFTGDSVKGIDIIAADGSTVASGKGNSVRIDNLSGGTYIVRATVGGKSVTRKVVISK